MGAQLRVYRQRMKSVQATKKITRAMELIAASRIVKAQARVSASSPYARAVTRAVSAVATFSNVDHPLTTEKDEVKRAAMLLITSDRGLAGAYSSSVLKEGERLAELLRSEGREVVPYVSGRKGVAFYRFRRREMAKEWTGDSDAPQFEVAHDIGRTLVAAFTDDGPDGVDEIHVVFTRFVNMVTQQPEVIRLLPLEVVEGTDAPEDADVLPLYEFEPSPEAVLDALLPRYVESRIFNCMLQAAASELAARQRAMKSATDNAEELETKLSRAMNRARQDSITSEIMEIVGGAEAMSKS